MTKSFMMSSSSLPLPPSLVVSNRSIIYVSKSKRGYEVAILAVMAVVVVTGDGDISRV